jgi:vacuolar protein sorting-associated protein VTA1
MSLIAAIKPYIKYSMEMKEHVPIVAYYCKLYAIQKGNEIIKNDQTGADTSAIKQFLLGEITDLENIKKNLPEGTTKAEHRFVVENFVTSIFTTVEKDERTCEEITKKNAIDFNRASHFIMLLSIFDDCWDETWEQRRKYCIFKAG